MRASARALLFVAVAACKKEDPPAAGALALDVEALDFGIVAVGAEASLSATLSNTGDAPANILSVTLVDGEADVFAVTRDLDVVAPGGAVVLTATFTPEERERSTGRFLVRTDDDTLPEAFVLLSGLGGAADVDSDGDGFSAADGDCNDGDAAIRPDAEEICDGRDDNCDGVSLADETDDDGDGHLACGDDCDDTDGYTYAGATERCDGIDNNCDGDSNETADDDADGQSVCEGDCDDAEPLAFAGNPEVCDGVDNDCAGGPDDIDLDGDGRSACSTDCDDASAFAYSIVVRTGGNPGAAGTDDDPVDSIANAIPLLAGDYGCNTILLYPGRYAGTSLVLSPDGFAVRGVTGDPSDVVLEAASGDRLFDSAGDVTFENLTFTGGDTAGDGGALRSTAGTVTLQDVVITGCHADGNGGGVAITGGRLDVLRGTRFEGNDAGGDGGAVSVVNALLDDTQGYYEGNHADGVGGGIALDGGAAELADVQLHGNSATDGGGVALTAASALTAERLWVTGNTATGDGGGLYVTELQDDDGWISNGRFQDNVAAGGFGGGIALEGDVALRILNNTLVTNDAASGSGIGAELDPAAVVEIAANVVVGEYSVTGVDPTSRANTVDGTFVGTVSDGLGGPLAATDVVRDPLLLALSDDANPMNDDLALQAGSLEIDSGPADPSFDDPDGSRNDRGFTGGPAAP